MYHPTLGRWLTEDPIGYAGGDTNLYRHVGNNPVIFVDPSGLFAEQYPRNPTPRELDYFRDLFPNSREGDITIVGPAFPNGKPQNCFGYSLGIDGIVVPGVGPYAPKDGTLKPLKPGDTLYLDYAIKYYEQEGFTGGISNSTDCKCEKGKVTVALYGKVVPGKKTIEVTHAARCDGDCKWRSKNGDRRELTELKSLTVLEDDRPFATYGKVVACLKKDIK